MSALNNYDGKNRLYKPKNLVVRKVDDFFLVLNPDIPNIMVMDDVGKQFFELCNGSLTADEIVKEIIKERKGKVSRDELSAFISSMLNANFLFLQPPLPPQKAERTLIKLGQLYFHITRACNLRCKHCYVEAGEPLENELTTTEALKVIEDFAQLGGEHLIITGGEPFMRKEMLYEVFEKARNTGIEKVFVETNGTLIYDKDVEICRRYDVEFGVSLDSPVQETNDYIRGVGSYEKSINTIKNLVRAKIRTKIGMTLMKPNIKEVEKMVYLAKELGANSITFNIVINKGRAKAHEDFFLSLEEMYSTTLAAWRKAREAGVETALENQFKSLEKLTKRDMCGAGTSLLLVSSNGDVYPCNLFLEFEEFKAGNIKKQRLEDIWKNSEALKKFRHLSVLDIEGCKNCELKFICGVCPGEIYKEHGSFNKKSSFCPLYKGIFWMLIEELAEKMWKE